MLIVRRDTLDEAVSELREVILGYLESACTGGWEKDLIPRPSPREDWLRYYWLLVLNTVKALFGRFQGDFLAFRRLTSEQRSIPSRWKNRGMH